jgi:hypothetical protein
MTYFMILVHTFMFHDILYYFMYSFVTYCTIYTSCATQASDSSLLCRTLAELLYGWTHPLCYEQYTSL